MIAKCIITLKFTPMTVQLVPFSTHLVVFVKAFSLYGMCVARRYNCIHMTLPTGDYTHIGKVPQSRGSGRLRHMSLPLELAVRAIVLTMEVYSIIKLETAEGIRCVFWCSGYLRRYEINHTASLTLYTVTICLYVQWARNS